MSDGNAQPVEVPGYSELSMTVDPDLLELLEQLGRPLNLDWSVTLHPAGSWPAITVAVIASLGGEGGS